MKLQSHFHFSKSSSRQIFQLFPISKPIYDELGSEIKTGTFYKCPVYDFKFVPL